MFWAILLLLSQSCNKELGVTEVPADKIPSPIEPNNEVKVNQNGDVIVGAPTDNSIILSIAAQNGTNVSVKYGIFKDQLISSKSAVVMNNHVVEIILNNLEPNKRYYYSVSLNDKQRGDVYSFVTRRPKGATFSFGVQGDSHPERDKEMFNASLYAINMMNVSERQPDLYFALGDDFSIERLIANNTVNQNNVNAIYSLQRKNLGMVGCNTSLFLVNGNHEQAAKYLLDGTAENAAVCAGVARKIFYPLPDPVGMYSGNLKQVDHIGYLKDYYSFEWGDALFVVIDPYWHSNTAVDNIGGSADKVTDPWASSFGKEQYEWLKCTLSESDAKFKFVFSHHVRGTGRGGIEGATLYEWGGYNNKLKWEFSLKRPDWEMPIHQLFVKYGVTIFFQGHDHLFCKQELDGVIYQSCPNPADNTYRAFNSDAYLSGDVLPNSGFVHVTVSSLEVTVDYRRAFLPDDGINNESAYSYTIHSK
ncbi:MAG: metallophosphoesterase [Tannerellaceae bacterium]